MKAPIDHWNQYWFKPASLFNLAVVRIISVGAQLMLVLFIGRKIGRAFRLVDLPDSLYDPPWVLRLITLPFGPKYQPDEVMLFIVTGILIASGLLALIGLFTNISLLVFTISNLIVNAYNYSFQEFHHSEAIMMIALLVLALSPCGRLLSVDYLINRRRSANKGWQSQAQLELDSHSIYAGWPLLVIQWMFGLIYLSGAFAKIYRSGLDWMNGYTLQFNLLDSGVRRTYPLGIWLGQQHSLAIIVSWITFLFEATFWLVPIFPKLAWIYVPVGIGMHLAIYLMMGPDFFEYVILYAVFVSWLTIFKFSAHQIHLLRAGFSRPSPQI